MRTIIAIILAFSMLMLSSCATTSNSSDMSKEDLLEQNDIYVPWWAQ